MEAREMNYDEHLRLKLDALEAEVQKLREALRFYADPDRWDGGLKAREALKT